jgi:Glycosyl hydrolase family 26
LGSRPWLAASTLGLMAVLAVATSGSLADATPPAAPPSWPGVHLPRSAGTQPGLATAAVRVRAAASGTRGVHLFGVNIGTMSELGQVATLSNQLRRPYDVVNFFADFRTPFPTPRLDAITAEGAVPSVTWEPWNYSLGAAQTSFPLTSIAAGKFDAYVASWARAAAAWRGPIVIRFGHEMNGNWYPWGLGVDGNTAAEYVAAWRHVHDVFVHSGATNVLWVWSPNAVWGPTPALRELYPGSAYVNFLGVDGYNFGAGLPYGGWRSAQAILDPTLTDFDTFAAGKPVLIAETASSEDGGSKSAWIAGLVPYLASRPQVAGFVWTEFPGSADWPLESSAANVAAMRTALAVSWSPGLAVAPIRSVRAVPAWRAAAATGSTTAAGTARTVTVERSWDRAPAATAAR